MRVCVPNLFQILSDYKNGSIDEHNDVQPEEFTEVNAPSLKLSMLLFGSVGSSQNNYRGHQMMYNFDGVKEVLESVGFVDVIPKPIDTSQSPFMCNKDVHRDMELIVECRK